LKKTKWVGYKTNLGGRSNKPAAKKEIKKTEGKKHTTKEKTHKLKGGLVP